MSVFAVKRFASKPLMKVNLLNVPPALYSTRRFHIALRNLFAPVIK